MGEGTINSDDSSLCSNEASIIAITIITISALIRTHALGGSGDQRKHAERIKDVDGYIAASVPFDHPLFEETMLT